MASNNRKTGNSVTQFIIHAGLPKTGTTSIQAMLADEACRLKERGVGVITRGNATVRLRRAGLSPSFRDAGIMGRLHHRREARKFWKDALSLNARRVLVSDENLLGIRSRDMFEPEAARRALRVAHQLRNALPKGSQLKFVLYDRDRDALHRSAWNQRRRKGSKMSYDEWSEKFPDRDAARSIIDGMSGAFGEAVTVVKMEDEIASGRFLGEQVLAAAGVPDYAAPAKIYRENVGQD